MKWEYSLIWWFVLNRNVETLIETDTIDEHVSKKCNVNKLGSHWYQYRKFAAENHSKVKQFDKEDILTRFKRADSTTTYVAVLVFFICQHNWFWRILSRQSTNIYREYFLSVYFVGCYHSTAKFCDCVPGRWSRACSCLSCITLEQASRSELSCLNIDKDSYVSLEKYKEPPISYRYFLYSTPLPQESPILQPEMVSRSCRSDTLKGTRRLPNHRSQNQDKNCTEDQHYRSCLNHTGVDVPHRLSHHHRG